MYDAKQQVLLTDVRHTVISIEIKFKVTVISEFESYNNISKSFLYRNPFNKTLVRRIDIQCGQFLRSYCVRDLR